MTIAVDWDVKNQTKPTCLIYLKPLKTQLVQVLNILKAIKNATGTSVIFPINTRLIHFDVVLTNASNIGERFTKT